MRDYVSVAYMCCSRSPFRMIRMNELSYCSLKESVLSLYAVKFMVIGNRFRYQKVNESLQYYISACKFGLVVLGRRKFWRDNA